MSNVAVAALNRAGLHKAQARFAATHHAKAAADKAQQPNSKVGDGSRTTSRWSRAVTQVTHTGLRLTYTKGRSFWLLVFPLHNPIILGWRIMRNG